MILTVPDPSLVLLVGPSGCGKSPFARAHFTPFEAVPSDVCRALVSNDETDQSATKAAFAVLHLVLARRRARAYVGPASPFPPHAMTAASTAAFAAEPP